MRRIRAAAFSVFSALLSCAAIATAPAGCAVEDGDAAIGDEEAPLTEAKTLAKGVAHPSGIAHAGGHVYFGSNKFIASGDPELDQQFAYWTGKFSRVKETGGRPETVAEIGPISRVKVAGSTLLYAMADGCWINALPAGASGDGTQIYSDPECDPEAVRGPAGFEVVGGKLVVLSHDGVVRRGNLDGSGMRKVNELRIGSWGDIVDSFAVAGDHLYVLTRNHLTDAQDHPVKQALYRLSVTSSAKTKVLELDATPHHLTSDGTNLYFTQDLTSVLVLEPGAAQPRTIAQGFAEISEIAADGKNVYVADSKRDAIYVVANALTAPKRQKKLAVAKGLETLVVSGDTIFFGSHVIENRKAAGIIGAVKIPAL